MVIANLGVPLSDLGVKNILTFVLLPKSIILCQDEDEGPSQKTHASKVKFVNVEVKPEGSEM